LTATVTDDGLPKPGRRRPAVGQETPPTLKYKGEPSPVNVPLPASPKPPQGRLSVGWIVYRGPGKVTFEPSGYSVVKDGRAVIRATFSDPGTYVLRGIASDGMLKTPIDVTVVVGQ
jgi:hypothetical protein